MSKKNITLEATGEFPFTFYIEKAEAAEIDNDLILEGIASTTNVDHDNERMSKEALRAMEATINKEGVPLRVEHMKDASAIIGRVFKAWVDDRNQLHIQAKLDRSHPVSPILHHAMKSEGTKMGLSVGGMVKRAVKEFAESMGGMVKTFYDVALQEVSVTPRPANYDAYLVAKHIVDDPKDAEHYYDNLAIRREFFRENPQLDYLQSFAKSIPDKAWRKVESPEINEVSKNMEKEQKEETTETTKGTKEEETTTEKSVTRSEFEGLSKAVTEIRGLMAKGFENIGAILNKAMESEPKDTTNPDKQKPEDESPTAKTTTETEETTKTGADGTDTEGEREKKEKASTKDDTYDLETVERSIKTIENLHKRLIGIKKTETEETKETTKAEETTEETTKHVHPLDEFVAKTTMALEAVVERMEKTGKRVLGFEKSFVEELQNNPEVQAEIQKMIKIPGVKKSVAMGVPYMALKDGRRMPLVAGAETVQKTEKLKGDFKSVYKSEFSSVSNPESNE